MREKYFFDIKHKNLSTFKQKASLWANQFETMALLDSNEYQQDQYAQYEYLIAIGKNEHSDTLQNKFIFNTKKGANFEALKQFYKARKDWLFGYLGYDLKNEVEQLESKNLDHLNFPVIYFFQPQIVISISKAPKHRLCIEIREESNFEANAILEAIEAINLPKNTSTTATKGRSFEARMSKESYLQKVKALQQHIIEGDIYEINLCQEFYIKNILIEPLAYFWHLNRLSSAPFSAYLKFDNKCLLCASPERFLQKNKQILLSQPIKGTIKRGKTAMEDNTLKKELLNNPKERAENVMIVDLVRNDLTRSATFGTIRVPELFGVYSFETVHHLVSTVSAELRDDVHFVDAIKNAFPMGSMTGAPKIMAMKLIEDYETSRRSVYSGAVGYITPDGDFDFNVLIRSLLYNQKNRYLSFQVGGAITHRSDPHLEYEECLLKAKLMRQMFV